MPFLSSRPMPPREDNFSHPDGDNLTLSIDPITGREDDALTSSHESEPFAR
ncbi:hypothetical protein H845_683 [Komagataeibacter xylinus E25]|nr:hypothetical protein H845_683 [Komagataeibacter xylinus E25]